MLELEHGFRVVDIHGHLDHDEVAVSTHGHNVGPDRLERECHQAGVVRTAVSPTRRPSDIGYVRANNAVARLSVDRPFLAFARLNGPLAAAESPISTFRNLYAPRETHHTRPGDIEQYAYDDRFHGFVLDPIHDGTQGVGGCRSSRCRLLSRRVPTISGCRYATERWVSRRACWLRGLPDGRIADGDRPRVAR